MTAPSSWWSTASSKATTDHITLKPEVSRRGANRDAPACSSRCSTTTSSAPRKQKIPVEQDGHDDDAHQQFPRLHAHARRSRTWMSRPRACAQVLITMAVESYRQGKVLYFDEKKWKVSDKPVKA